MRYGFRLNISLSTMILLWSATAAHAQVFDLFTPLEAGDFEAAAVGDLNSDGRADVMVFRPSTVSDVPSTWDIKLNDGSGHFTTTFSLEQGPGTGPPIIADVNDDGQADIVMPDGVRIRVFWNGGAGQSFSYSEISGFTRVAAVAVGDVDGDTDRDLAVADRTLAGLFIVRTTQPQQFGPREPVGSVSSPRGVGIGDVTGDGRPDLVVINQPGIGSAVSVLAGDGAMWSRWDSFSFPMGNSAMTLADVNNDGLTDIVLSIENAFVQVRLGTRTPPLAVAAGTGVRPSLYPPSVVDLNGDGRPEIVVSLYASGNGAVVEYDGDITLTPTSPFAIAADQVAWSATADFDGDGRTDILAGTATQLTLTRQTAPSTPPRIQAFAESATAGADGTALITATVQVAAGYPGATFTWFEGSNLLGTGEQISVRLSVGVHTLSVRGIWPDGFEATATAEATVLAPPPPPEPTIATVQNTLDAKLDTTVSSRASQQSIAQLETRIAAIETRLGTLATEASLGGVGAIVQSQLDVPVSSRASAVGLAAVEAKVDELKTSLPSGALLTQLTQSVNALGASLGGNQLRIAIEQALGRAEMIASFYLPTANGGQLDLVRSIVIDVVDKSDAAGGNATNVARARRLLGEADTRKAAGDYRAAYLLYMGAYQVLAGLSR